MAVTGDAVWHVYIVRCVDGSLYTGITKDVDARVAAHNAGRGAKYTRGRTPVQLVYVEPAADHPSALRREASIKRLTAKRKHRLLSF